MNKLIKSRSFQFFLLASIPIAAALFVWLSALAFVPVPWPDDSAFYFVGKDFFQWPPRWVMIPQSPFEPTYRIFNFNTMPLYPILIGLGRYIGIDGSFLLKIWPLSAWALSGSLMAVVLYEMGLPFFLCLLPTLAYALDPILRWSSVLVRPESLIGLFGMALVLGLTFGFPKRFEPRKFWDPVAALLALAAYCHFNAIHLLIPTLFVFAFQPKRLIEIGAKAALYLSPWLLMVLIHWNLFFHQMELQWSRFAAGNNWLDSPVNAMHAILPNMGSPEPWDFSLEWTSMGMWIILLVALGSQLLIPGILSLIRILKNKPLAKSSPMSLVPAAGWILAATWLYHSKPEVWFNYYLHESIWCFSGLALLKLWQIVESRTSDFNWAKLTLGAFGSLLLGTLLIFGWNDVSQASRLDSSVSWHWSTYNDFVNCVDQQLVQYQAVHSPGKPLHVWCPTFPDITIELSRKHPDWEMTRTNDFWQRWNLAVEHGRTADAVVVTETVNPAERIVSDKMEAHPEIQSSWMTWREYFLYALWASPGWKPNRYICQRGRWQAFLFMESVPSSK